MHYNDIVKNGGTLGVLERDGDEYVVVESHRVTGCGSKFDGRMSYTLRRVSDGKLFGWLGSRHTKKVPHNAKLSERT
jgi:hypothetical protein